jgi:hypothetical protein
MQIMNEAIIEQRTAEWHAQRLGKVTASRVGDATSRLKNNGYGAQRANYLMQLAVERLTGDPIQTFDFAARQWGANCEPYARAAYAAYCGLPVIQVGFIDHPTIAMCGSSSDGLVNHPNGMPDGMIEIKCPTSGTHIKTLLGEPIDADYVKQMSIGMACRPERKWCDFVSFDPRLPTEYQLYVRRFERDDIAIANLEDEIRLFLAEVDAKIAALAALVALAA